MGGGEVFLHHLQQTLGFFLWLMGFNISYTNGREMWCQVAAWLLREFLMFCWLSSWQDGGGFQLGPFTHLKSQGAGSCIWLNLQGWHSEQHRLFFFPHLKFSPSGRCWEMCSEADIIDQHLWEGNQSYSLPAKIGSVYTLLGESVLSVTEQMSTRGLAGPSLSNSPVLTVACLRDGWNAKCFWSEYHIHLDVNYCVCLGINN